MDGLLTQDGSSARHIDIVSLPDANQFGPFELGGAFLLRISLQSQLRIFMGINLSRVHDGLYGNNIRIRKSNKSDDHATGILTYPGGSGVTLIKLNLIIIPGSHIIEILIILWSLRIFQHGNVFYIVPLPDNMLDVESLLFQNVQCCFKSPL